jgi:hypothetical protein
MTTSAAPHVYKALVNVKKAVSKVGLGKGRQAPKEAGGYAFRGIDDVYNVLCEIEAQEGVMALPSIISKQIDYQEKNGKIQTHIHIEMLITFVSEVDGSTCFASGLGEGIDTGDKCSSKTQSSAMKQIHLEVYKIPTEGLSEDIEQTNQEIGKKVPATLEKKLEASVGWGEWEAEQAAVLRTAKTSGELLEAWSAIAPLARGAPNGTLKRLAAIKDERKNAVRIPEVDLQPPQAEASP